MPGTIERLGSRRGEGVDNNRADVFVVEQKLPVVGDYFIREIPPSDNVSALLGADREWGLCFLSTAVLRRLSMGSDMYDRQGLRARS